MRMLARDRSAGGQSLVEFALVAPIFFLLLFAVIDFGFFAFTNSVMSQAAREGARTASVQASWIGESGSGCNQPGGPVCPSNATDLANRVTTAVRAASTGLTSPAAVHIQCSDSGAALPTGAWTSAPATCTSSDAGDFVSVRLVYGFRPLTPVGLVIFGNPSNQSGSATMVIN